MSEEIKGVFIKQMLLPKEELALQTMELMADKMELEKQVEQLENKIKEAMEYIYDNEKEYGSLEENEKIILNILNKGDNNVKD